MAVEENGTFRKDELAYDMGKQGFPIYVGEGFGAMTYSEAIELSLIKRRAMGFPETRESIAQVVPRPTRRMQISHTSRASKNNPYVCIHCEYKTTRCGNMVKHLEKLHNDHSTDPRDNRR